MIEFRWHDRNYVNCFWAMGAKFFYFMPFCLTVVLLRIFKYDVMLKSSWKSHFSRTLLCNPAARCEYDVHVHVHTRTHTHVHTYTHTHSTWAERRHKVQIKLLGWKHACLFNDSRGRNRLAGNSTWTQSHRVLNLTCMSPFKPVRK